MCEETIKAIQEHSRKVNLTTGKELYRKKLTFTNTDTNNRHSISFEPEHETCGFLLRIANLPTVDGVDAATVYFSIDSQHSATNELTALVARGGGFIEAAGGYSKVFAQNKRRFHLDFCALGIDQATKATASVVVTIEELIPLKAEDC